MDPELILLNVVREYPDHTPAFYAELCRFNLDWTRATLFKMAQRQDVVRHINFHSDSDATYRAPSPMSTPSDTYRHCNHHHELTEDHALVDFGDGEFVANKAAIPLLKALADLGLRTRTHHVDENGGFFSILLNPTVEVEIRTVHERDSTRDKYNGMFEVLLSWRQVG